MKSRNRYYQSFEKQSEKSSAASFPEAWPPPLPVFCLPRPPPSLPQTTGTPYPLPLDGRFGHAQILRVFIHLLHPSPIRLIVSNLSSSVNCQRPVCPPPALSTRFLVLPFHPRGLLAQSPSPHGYVDNNMLQWSPLSKQDKVPRPPIDA